MIGGAFGAKVGAFLSTILESPKPVDFIEFGFIIGSTICISITVLFLLIISISRGGEREISENHHLMEAA